MVTKQSRDQESFGDFSGRLKKKKGKLIASSQEGSKGDKLPGEKRTLHTKQRSAALTASLFPSAPQEGCREAAAEDNIRGEKRG